MKDEPSQDPFQRLRSAANGARMVLNRVAGEGAVIGQIERGEWSGALTAQQATDVAGPASTANALLRPRTHLCEAVMVPASPGVVRVASLRLLVLHRQAQGHLLRRH